MPTTITPAALAVVDAAVARNAHRRRVARPAFAHLPDDAARRDAAEYASAPDDVLTAAAHTFDRRHGVAQAAARLAHRDDDLDAAARYDTAARAWQTAANLIRSTLDARARGIVAPGTVTRPLTFVAAAAHHARTLAPETARRAR